MCLLKVISVDGRKRIANHFLQRRRRKGKSLLWLVTVVALTLGCVRLFSSWRTESETQEERAGKRRMHNTSKRNNSTWMILDVSDDYQTDLSVLIHHKHIHLIAVKQDGSFSCSPGIHCEEISDFIPVTEILLMPLKNTEGQNAFMATKSKMAAVLFAISQGAQWLYVGDESTMSAVSRFENLEKRGRKIGLVYDTPGYFHPIHHHFGQDWFNNKDGALRAARYKLKIVSASTGSVYLIYDDCVTQTLCLESNPPIYINSGTLTSLPSTSILVHRETAWFLLSSILRHYSNETTSLIGSILQRLLWDTKHRIAFVPSVPDSGIPRSSRCLNGYKSCRLNSTKTIDKNAERNSSCFSDINYSHNVRKFQRQIKKTFFSLENLTFHEWTQELITSFLKEHDLDEISLKITSDWLKTLKSLGYKFPSQVSFLNKRKTKSGAQWVPIWFTPSPCKPSQRFMFYKTQKEISQSEKNVTVTWKSIFKPSLCQEENGTVESLIPQIFRIPDILLIIVFNYPYLASHIPVLLAMYGRHFHHILFCGEHFSSFTKFYKMESAKDVHVTFVEVNHFEGTWGYSCMSTAIKMGYDVTGYLQLSDDVLLNLWNLEDIPRDRFWYQSRVRVADIRLARLPDIATTNRWYPWIFQVGQYAAQTSFNLLKTLDNEARFHQKIHPYLSRLAKNTQCTSCLMYEASDIFYVPSHSAKMWAFFADVFQANGVHLEIAIPSAIFGLAPEAEVYRLRGNYVWGDDRPDFRKYYSPYDHFQHAFKLSRLANAEGASFFCEEYIPWLERDLVSWERKSGLDLDS